MGVCAGPEPLRGRPRASILLNLGAPCGQSGASSIPALSCPAPHLGCSKEAWVFSLPFQRGSLPPSQSTFKLKGTQLNSSSLCR